MKIAGFDIGGANTDLAVVEFDESGDITGIETDFKYFPMWTNSHELENVLKELLGKSLHSIDAVGISMTAELVDAYKTKEEGVLDIAEKSMNAFQIPVGFVGQDGIEEYVDLKNDPMKFAAANWIATAPLAAKIEPNCIMVDTGSTTTDIIPIINGKECAEGRSDLERLKTGELVYSGVLRTNVAALVDEVPVDGEKVRVASELFAVTADVNMVLGNITEDMYTCDTMDGSGKAKEDCMRRISRVVCGDMNVLKKENIHEISEHIYSEQVKKISEAILEVSERNNIYNVVTTGLGMDITGASACELAGLEYKKMDLILEKEDCVNAAAVGTAIMMENFRN